VAHQQQVVTGVAGRYARALYELAQESEAVDETAGELERFQALLDSSEDLRRLVMSPVFSAEEQTEALKSILAAEGITGLAGRLILLLAKNRRLPRIGEIIQAYRALVAAERGEVMAEVTAATDLSHEQVEKLRNELTARMGRNVVLVAHSQPELIGGLILKIGSRMIDDSIKTKLSRLKLTMKGAG
jgi:F-type H+-transporting ATPase subunit delta